MLSRNARANVADDALGPAPMLQSPLGEPAVFAWTVQPGLPPAPPPYQPHFLSQFQPQQGQPQYTPLYSYPPQQAQHDAQSADLSLEMQPGAAPGLV